MNRAEMLAVIKSLPHNESCPCYTRIDSLSNCYCGKLHIEKDLMFGEKGKSTLLNLNAVINKLEQNIPHAITCITASLNRVPGPGEPLCLCGRTAVLNFLYTLKSQK